MEGDFDLEGVKKLVRGQASAYRSALEYYERYIGRSPEPKTLQHEADQWVRDNLDEAVRTLRRVEIFTCYPWRLDPYKEHFARVYEVGSSELCEAAKATTQDEQYVHLPGAEWVSRAIEYHRARFTSSCGTIVQQVWWRALAKALRHRPEALDR